MSITVSRVPTVVLFDRQRMFVEALVSAISRTDRIHVLGISTDPSDVEALCERARPDLLVADLPSLIRQPQVWLELRRNESVLRRCMVLSDHCSEYLLSESLTAGVRGYMLKTDSFPEVVERLIQAAGGQAAFSAAVQSRLVQDPSGRMRLQTVSEIGELSALEINLLRQVALGLTGMEIAVNLKVSYKAADAMRFRLMRKLKIRNKVHLAEFARREGLLLDEGEHPVYRAG